MRKRGLVWVVLMLIVASSVVAIDWVDAPRLSSLYVYLLNEKGCSYDSVGDDEIPADGDYINARSEVGAYCSLRTDGCVAEVRREEKAPCVGCFDFHYCLSVKKGIKLDNTYSENIFRNSNVKWFGDFKEDPVSDSDCSPNECEGCSIASSLDEQDCGDIGCANIKSPVNGELMCGEDSLWARCIKEDVGKITRVEDSIYNCTYENLQAKWVRLQGEDRDGDSYTTSMGDCADNPTNDPAECDSVTADSCSNLQYSKCAVCINPEAKEVCGDTIDNDCNADTPESCDKNQWACEQIADPNQPSSQPQRNKYDDYGFHWTPTGGGHCCGFYGISDLGKIFVGEGSESDDLCLNKENNLVETEGGAEGLTDAFGTAPDKKCDSKTWCAISATNPANQFKVFTINFPQVMESSDVVSNGLKWHYSDAFAEKENVAERTLTAPSPGDITENIDQLREKSNRFQAYQEGSKRWSWAECAGDYSDRQNKGVKGRYAGEGVYALPLIDETGAHENRSGQSVEIIAEDYEPFYHNDKMLDFSSYDFLNFMVAFTNEDGSKLTTPLNLPANVILEIYGPDAVPGEEDLYFEDAILGYVINNPALPGDNFLHVQVPIIDYVGVTKIRIIADPINTNSITVKNVYLSKKDETNLCSGGKSYEDKDSIWIDNVDESDTEHTKISGELICKALYGENAWLGDDLEVNDEEARCCGDDPNEFYAGKSEFDFGCWNAIPIKSGNTTMDVQFNASYYLREYVITYPDVDFKVAVTYPKVDVTRVDVDHGCPSFNFGTEKEKLDGCSEAESCSMTRNGCSNVIKEGQEEQCKISYTIIKDTTHMEDDPNCVAKNDKIYQCYADHNCDYPSANTPDSCTSCVGDSSASHLEEPCPQISVPSSDTEEKTKSFSCDRPIIDGTPITREEINTKEEVIPDGKYYCLKGKDECYTKSQTEVTALDESKNDQPYQDFPMIFPMNLNKSDLQDSLDKSYAGQYTLTINSGSVKASFMDPLHLDSLVDKTTITMDDFESEEREVYVKVELTDAYQIDIDKNLVEVNDEIRTYSCNKDECLYPVPGWIPAEDQNFWDTIRDRMRSIGGVELSETTPLILSNPHPELYDLYYVKGSNADGSHPENEVLLGKKPTTFDYPGNLKVKKLSQQVLYFDPGTESTQPPAFYGCQAANYLSPYLTNLDVCSVKAGYFCSPSTLIKKTVDYYTAINTWSNVELSWYGYKQFTQEPDSTEEIQLVPNSVEDYPFSNQASVFEVVNYTHLTSSFPTQNFIPNAQLNRWTVNGLPYWKILQNGREVTNYAAPLVEEGAVKLNPGMQLISERIAILNKTLDFNSTLAFSDNGDCDFEINRYDNNGVPVGDPITTKGSFPALGNFVVISYTADSACTVKLPNLQVSDQYGASNTSYKSQQDTLKNYDFRAGQACCPQNWCWNGYTCVEPMDPYSKRAEHTPDGRDYRCIKGEWTALPPKMDWKNLDWGFCQQPEQCYVISAEGHAERAQTNVSEFTKQLLATTSLPENAVVDAPVFPSCLNNGEYLFDNYCENGNWTSRTKFLAAKMLGFAVGTGNSYSLYCTDIDLALADPKVLEKYAPELTGGGEQAEPEVDPSGQAVNAQLNVEKTCFSVLNSDPFVTNALDQDNKDNLLVTHKQNKCVNNICILKYLDGSEEQVAVGTTLNKPVDTAENSFLLALDVPFQEVSTVCNVTATDSWRKCQDSLWYWENFSAVIYDQDGIVLQPSTIETILQKFMEFVAGLFGENMGNNQIHFLEQAQNYNTVFMLKEGPKEIRAVKETIGKAQTISAEFDNFKTNICEYANTAKINVTGIKAEVLEGESGMDRLTCTKKDQNTQIIKATSTPADPLDSFWPQLTGMLRVAKNE